MKIRHDFVTNSSSSSFILGFNNEAEIENIIKNELPEYWSDSAIQSVIEDVKDGITSKEEAISLYKDSIGYWNFCFKGKTYWDMTEEEISSSEWCNFKNSMTNDMVNKFTNELNAYDVISIVEYEDHTNFGSELEHDIMPYLDSTIQRISHH